MKDFDIQTHDAKSIPFNTRKTLLEEELKDPVITEDGLVIPIKYKVRFGEDLPDALPGILAINPKFAYKNNDDMTQKDKAPKEIFDHINEFTQKMGEYFK